MENKILGLHHITAIAGNAQRNFDFYTKILGLRLVKKTVNFDDPGTYHFYFGDEIGTPGSILTFFPWANVKQGKNGTGMATDIGYSVPAGSLEFWHIYLIVTLGSVFSAFQEPDISRSGLNSDAAPRHEAGAPRVILTLCELHVKRNVRATCFTEVGALWVEGAEGFVVKWGCDRCARGERSGEVLGVWVFVARVAGGGEAVS